MYGVTPSTWYIEGCDVYPGGGLFHRGGLVIATRTSRFAAKARISESRLMLEIPAPSTWKTGHRPQPVSLVFSFSRWRVRDLSPGGFKADAQLRVASGLTKGLTVPAGLAGSLSLDVRVARPITGLKTAVSCFTGPTAPLPRVKGGLIYPLLADSVVFRTPVANLYSRLGRPPGEHPVEHGWQSGPDAVFPIPVLPVDGRAGVEVLLKDIIFSTENVQRSQLKGWRTPEGIHIGSTRADFSRAYPGTKIGGLGGAGFMTRPYAVVSAGRQTRQRFFVAFGFPSNGPSVRTIRAELHGEEGTCWVHWRHEQDYMEFEATCFGPLVSALFEPVSAAPRFARDLGAGGEIRSAVDDEGKERYLLHFEPVRGQTAPNRISWRVECEPGFPPPRCAPGRGAGEEQWPSGSFEEWDLSFAGYSARPAPPKASGAGPKIPPVRFVAEFLGMPPFAIVISRAY